MRSHLITLPLVLLAAQVQAQDAALVLGNESYRELARVSRADDVLGAATELQRAGFDVFSLRNGTSDRTFDALSEFVAASEDADRLAVILSGHFVTDGARTWFLTTDAEDLTLFDLGRTAISVDSLLQVLSQTPGQAVLVLGPHSVLGPRTGPWLRYGLGQMDIPQGVTVVRGQPRDIANFAEDELATSGNDLADVIADDSALRVEGYIPRNWVFIADEDTPVRSVTPEADDTAPEDLLWEGAAALDTIAAYRNYLRRFPDGRYSAEASRMIAEIENEPNRAARKAEDALELSRDARREIQRDLTLLGYNTRGIDGIFGPGSRRAIANWQQENGYPQTTYMNREQANRLDAQSARRAAELEAEAERQRAEQARLDRAYWDETGARGDEPGYRAYIDRFPDGIYAEIAADRLADIEAAKRAAAEVEDRAAWDDAKEFDTVESYRDYLQEFPDGVFRAEAQARIAAKTEASDSAADTEEAQAQEQRLRLNPITARLVEGRLRQLGLDPGPVDGRFDDKTRRAIRRYQQARNLPITGYLNEATIVRLLADSVTVIGR